MNKETDIPDGSQADGGKLNATAVTFDESGNEDVCARDFVFSNLVILIENILKLIITVSLIYSETLNMMLKYIPENEWLQMCFNIEICAESIIDY